MRLATIRADGATAAVRIDATEAVETGAGDVGDLLRHPGWRDEAANADGVRHPLDSLDYAPLVIRPAKIVCVGLNYRSHIVEMGHDLPEYPTLFAKYSSALIGARDAIVLPAVSSQVDWEVELGIVIGAPARHVTTDDAEAAIGGYTVVNDVSMRDWQHRSAQWLQGKTFESSTPVGPQLVVDHPHPAEGFEVTCEVNGEQMQKATTSDLMFGPAALVAYLSDIFTLEPGDVIATGTPGGVGVARHPRRFLTDGDEVVTRVEGVGECRNRCRRESPPR